MYSVYIWEWTLYRYMYYGRAAISSRPENSSEDTIYMYMYMNMYMYVHVCVCMLCCGLSVSAVIGIISVLESVL